MQTEAFKTAFNSWAACNWGLARDSSRTVYESIWSAFSDYSRASTPAQVTASDIAGYLANRSDSPEGLTLRYQARVVMLIDKVLCFDAEAAGRKPPKAVQEVLKNNPALRAAMVRHRADSPDLEYLDKQEFDHLVDVLQAWPRDFGRTGKAARWQDARDRTSLALLLGAGLSPTDIRNLMWRAAGQAGKTDPLGKASNGTCSLRIPKNGRLVQRTARVDAWAVPMLEDWLTVFEAQSLDSDWLFPGRKQAASAWSKPSQYESARNIMRAAGIEGSSFKLRHTWALKTLAEGAAEADVARWLGVLDDEVMARYRDGLEEFRGNWRSP